MNLFTGGETESERTQVSCDITHLEWQGLHFCRTCPAPRLRFSHQTRRRPGPDSP